MSGEAFGVGETDAAACPSCLAPLDGWTTAVGDGTPPDPDDRTVCAYCLQGAKYDRRSDGRLTLIPLTAAEAAEPEWIAILEQVRAALRANPFPDRRVRR